MLPELGFSLQPQYDLMQVVPMLKRVGFSAVSPLWSADLDMHALAACARAHNMIIQSLHAPHKNIAFLWQPDSQESAIAQENIFRSIDACAEHEIPILVVQGWQGRIYTFPDTPLDFRVFDRLMDYAEQKGVTIAFENLEGEEYLQALMERYPNAGFCWDSGHDHCYPHKTDFLKAFGHRLIMTHLNDNFGLRHPNGIPSGNDDLHLLPHDGTVDWDQAIGRLKSMPKQEILNFEIKIRSHSTAPEDLPYVNLSLEQFFELAATRARQIAKLYFES